MKSIASAVFMTALLGFSLSLRAYEVQTHEEMSERAMNSSKIAKDQELLKNFGLKSLAEKQKFPNSNNIEQTIRELFRTGANFEDTLSADRPRNHFYDPLSSEPLTISGKAVGSTSPDWALEDKGQITGTLGFGKQEFSYRDAREYFFNALTLPGKTDREKNFGLTFQTIGMVIHHVQDMAQPQHVRNDQHLELPPPTGPLATGFCNLSPILCGLYFAAQNPSLYESSRGEIEAADGFYAYRL